MVHFKCSWLLHFQLSLLFTGIPGGSLHFKDLICGFQSYNQHSLLTQGSILNKKASIITLYLYAYLPKKKKQTKGRKKKRNLEFVAS